MNKFLTTCALAALATSMAIGMASADQVATPQQWTYSDVFGFADDIKLGVNDVTPMGNAGCVIESVYARSAGAGPEWITPLSTDTIGAGEFIEVSTSSLGIYGTYIGCTLDAKVFIRNVAPTT